jgi:predicted DNA binding protein
MYEATFELKGDGLVTDLAREYDAAIQLWCNDHCDLLYVRSESLDGFLNDLTEAVGVEESIREGDQLVAVTTDCLRSKERTLIESYIAEHGCLSLPPLMYEGRIKRSKVLALDAANLTAMYDDLRSQTSVTVCAKREIQSLQPELPVLGLDDLLPQLSSRQFEVFRTADEFGYYEIPRRTTTEEIGEHLGIDRRTVEDHLRRAENKIVAALAEHFTLLQ